MKPNPKLVSLVPLGAASVAARGIAGAIALCGLVSCGQKADKDAPINPQSLPGNASRTDIGTKLGNGHVIDTGTVNVATSTQWTRVYPMDKSRLFLGGNITGEGYALITTDRGATWKALDAKAEGMVTWSVGSDGSVIMAIAKRAVPAKPLPEGTQAPIDTLTLLFASPDQPKLSTPSPFLAPDPTGKVQKPTIPRGEGMPTVLGPNLASVVVELKPGSFGIAYLNPAAPPSDQLPPSIALPSNEVPVNAPYGHPPQLLTTNGKQLLVRPWPLPTDKLAEPKVLDKVVLTRTLESDLSLGPECEWGNWSFRRILQDKSGVQLLGISPDKTAFFPLPPTMVGTSPIGCNAEKIVVEYIDEGDKLTRVAACNLDGNCTKPSNRAFLKPWTEQHKRDAFFAPTSAGIVTVQQLRARVKWTVDLGFSKDSGLNFQVPAPFGEGDGNPEDGYGVGALVPMGDRTMLILSAKVSRTTRRSWYAIASDDNGETWIMP